MIRVVEMNRVEEHEGQETWTHVCPLAQIVPNMGVCCLVAGKQVAVFRMEDGRLFAIGNHDPFSKANVLSRGIVGDRNGRAKVASPIYKQSFCLATGECLDDPSVSVPSYEVRVRDEIVEVKEPITRPLRTGNSGLLSDLQRA